MRDASFMMYSNYILNMIIVGFWIGFYGIKIRKYVKFVKMHKGFCYFNVSVKV
jgi:hypothetical protein